MKRLAYTLAQITWGFPQTLLGAIVFLAHTTRPHFGYHGAVGTVWRAKSSVSLGLFVFVAERPEENPQLLAHEYGHTIQSLIFGPAYLLVIGIPSFLWATLPQARRRRATRGTDYYSFYTERTANNLFRRFIQTPKQTHEAS